MLLLSTRTLPFCTWGSTEEVADDEADEVPGT